MSLAERIASLDTPRIMPPATTTAAHWFTTVESFSELCSSARAQAHAPRVRGSDWDQEFAARLKFRQLLFGLSAPLRAVELGHLYRIAMVVPSSVSSQCSSPWVLLAGGLRTAAARGVAVITAVISARVRTIALPARVLKRWDAIAAVQLYELAADLDAENEQLQRRLRWAEQLAHHSHEHSTTWDGDAGVGTHGVALQVLA